MLSKLYFLIKKLKLMGVKITWGQMMLSRGCLDPTGNGGNTGKYFPSQKNELKNYPLQRVGSNNSG
jgi:hypothetical protein